MGTSRFDALTTSLAGRLPRRAALQVTGAGVAATGFATTGLAGFALRRARAQDATPAATPDPLTDRDRTYFLFVQTFHAGTLTPHPTAADTYTLTLTGAVAQTVYFSDRPERIVGTLPTMPFLEGLGFQPDNPPNAALVAQTDAGEEIVVVELLNPVYTEGVEPDAVVTLTYDVRILTDYQEDGLAHLAARQGDADLPASFDAGSLFIDDCDDRHGLCEKRAPDGIGWDWVGDLGSVGFCWKWDEFRCTPCHDLNAQCNTTFPACQNACRAGYRNLYCGIRVTVCERRWRFRLQRLSHRDHPDSVLPLTAPTHS